MLKTAVKAARAAGKILMKHFGKIENVEAKDPHNLVTNVDLACEKKILEIIKKKFPDHNIYSEEAGNEQKKSEYTWYIDPLDGTHNYIAGTHMFGLARNNEMIVGVIYLPYFKELYTAEKGKGAFLNGKKIHVSKRKLSDSRVVFDSNLYKGQKLSLILLDIIRRKVFMIRMLGVAVLNWAYLSTGRFDFHITFDTKPWDIAAGALIVEEAGGKVTRFDGKPWNVMDKQLIFSNGVLHDELVRLIKSAK